MTPKEKAMELVNKFTVVGLQRRNEGIQCALIAVDLLISETFLDFFVNHPQPFWQEVKTELEKL